MVTGADGWREICDMFLMRMSWFEVKNPNSIEKFQYTSV